MVLAFRSFSIPPVTLHPLNACVTCSLIEVAETGMTGHEWDISNSRDPPPLLKTNKITIHDA